MNIRVYGADAEALEQLAGEFRRTADQIESESNALGRLLGQDERLGGGATRFIP